MLQQDSLTRNKPVALFCDPAQALAIVQPVMEMATLVLGMGAGVKREEMLRKTAAFQEAKKKLARLMESRIAKHFHPEQLHDISVRACSSQGYFDLDVTEISPSQEGNVKQVYRLKLTSHSMENVLDKFAAFIARNNGGTRAYDEAKVMMGTIGL